MNQRIIVWGAGGHAKEVADAIRANGDTPVIRASGPEDPNWAKVGSLSELNALGADGWIVAIGDNAVRRACVLNLQDVLFCPPLAVIHPMATVSPNATIGPAVYIAAGAVVQMAIVGIGTIVNSGAVVSHDCVVGPYCHVAPNATLCGGCAMGRLAFVGAGAVVKPGVSVGESVVVGCGSAVVNDVTYGVWAGVPAKPMSRKEGHGSHYSL